jgi:hypothetical protein
LSKDNTSFSFFSVGLASLLDVVDLALLSLLSSVFTGVLTGLAVFFSSSFLLSLSLFLSSSVFVVVSDFPFSVEVALGFSVHKKILIFHSNFKKNHIIFKITKFLFVL